MNLRQLRYFIGIVDAGNMTRAAEHLNVAQTALSMQIRQLEEDLGVALLVRHSRGIEPTEAGKLLHARATGILRQVEDARREVASAGAEIHETVRLGITPALMLAIGAELIIRIRELAPNVSMSLTESMSHVLFDELRRGEIDFALCYDVPDEPHFARTAFLQEDLVLVTQPDEVRKGPVALVDALDGILAMPEAADTVRQAVARAAREIGLEVRVSYEIRSVAAMKSLAQKGAATCILPFASVAGDVHDGKLAARPIMMPPIRRTLYLAAPAQRPELRSETAIRGAVRDAATLLLDMLGTLAHPLWARAS
jgi:LysR family transcriptional regulator, nitrogen assimilation regulatory protein